MDTVKIGIIGCGYWGPNLIRNFAELPNVEIGAVADLREERLAYIRSRYRQIPLTKDYTDLFHLNLDGVVIATPPAKHFEIASQCLEHGLHVLIEKPMTLCSQDAERLIDTANQHDLLIMVGHTFEYNPAVNMLKEIITSGELGEIFYISTLRLNLGLFQPDLNVIWDLAPHDISILRYLTDCEPLSVSASGSSHILENVHDIAVLSFNFPNNIQAHSRVSWLDPRKERSITVVGSKKMVVYDDVAATEKIKIYDKGVEPPYANSFGEFQLHYHNGDVISPYVSLAEPLRLECQHFVECIQRGQHPRSDGEDGLSVVRILEATNRSLSNGSREEMLDWSSTYEHAAS